MSGGTALGARCQRQVNLDPPLGRRVPERIRVIVATGWFYERRCRASTPPSADTDARRPDF